MGYDRDINGRWLCTACGRVRGTHAPGCTAAAVEESIQRRAYGRVPWYRPDRPPPAAGAPVLAGPRQLPGKGPGNAVPAPAQKKTAEPVRVAVAKETGP